MENEGREKVQKRFRIYIMIILIAMVLSASFASFSYGKRDKDKNNLQTGTLILDLKEDSDLTLVNSAPMSDSDAITGDSYDFTVKNTGTENSKYRIYLLEDTVKYQEDNCSDKKMPWGVLRYSLEKNGEVGSPRMLPDDGVLNTSILDASKTDTYKLRVWIASSSGNEVAGLHFHAKLKIKAILKDRTDYDTGA